MWKLPKQQIGNGSVDTWVQIQSLLRRGNLKKESWKGWTIMAARVYEAALKDKK